DVPACGLRQTGVPVAVVEGVGAAFPQRLVRVHARAVVAVDRLRHEGGDFAVRLRDVADDVLVPLRAIALLRERAELHRELVLAGSGTSWWCTSISMPRPSRASKKALRSSVMVSNGGEGL